MTLLPNQPATRMRAESFERECDRTVGEFRDAIRVLYDIAGADAQSPQVVSRKFGINKNLTWKISKILSADDPTAALQHVPGRSGLKILVEAMGDPTPDQAIHERIKTAAEQVEAMVQRHIGDKATLDLVLDGLDALSSEKLEISRRHLYLGASGLWGIQARAAVFTAYVAPVEDDPTHLQVATINGYHRLKRLRNDIRWPLFRLTSWGEGLSGASSHVLPLDPSAVPGVPHLLPGFTSNQIPPIEVRPDENGTEYILTPGPMGNAGASDIFLGQRWPATINRYATQADQRGSFGPSITVPSECVVIDIFAHESLGYLDRLEEFVYGFPRRPGESTPSEPNAMGMLPIPTQRMPLAPSADTSLEAHPEQGQLNTWGFDKLNWNPADFKGIRLEMKYPPYGASVGVRFELDQR